MLNLLHKIFYKILYKSVEPGGKIKNCVRRACFGVINNYKRKYTLVKMHLTNICNLKCKNCYCQSEKESSLGKTEIISFLDQLGKMHFKNLNFHILGGEPLLRSDILEIISYAKNKIKIKQVLMFTNGTLVTDELAYKMKKAGLDAAIVTLHSHRDDIHDLLTQYSGSWNKAVSGIKNLINAGIQTYSFTVLMSCNADHLRQIEYFVKRLGAKTMYFPYIKQKENDNLCIESKDRFQQSIQWLFNKSKKHKRELLEILLKRGKSCLAFANVINIKSDGTVTPCPLLNLKLGNIKDEQIVSILDKAYYNQELLDFLSVPQECKGCSLVSVCGGGCKAFKYNFYHDAKSKDYNCSGPYKERIALEELGNYMPYLL